MVFRSREERLTHIQEDASGFDIVIIGGGITGAGIAREAAGSGLRTLLVEQHDFAWGSSSRSSKMVHGGLRYLGSGRLRLTRDAVRERERLLHEAPGLIDPMRFLMPHYRRQFPGRRTMGLLLRLYDRLAGQSSRRFFTPAETRQWAPGLITDGLTGASSFVDAVTDDARLVQRLLEEAARDGAVCINYLQAVGIKKTGERVRGVTLQDAAGATRTSFEVSTPVVINATGVWAGDLCDDRTQRPSIRPLRGSHLVIPFSVLPISCCVSLLHPDDRRPVFAFPWLGATILGTTDLDHTADLNLEPRISNDEIDYLLRIASTLFPGLEVSRRDILSTWAGVRPVVSSGKGLAPSKENREHVIWGDQGLISVTGGKLTTFRQIARQVLTRSLPYLDAKSLREESARLFRKPPVLTNTSKIGRHSWKHLRGSYGKLFPQVLACVPTTSLGMTVGTTATLWAELIWAATHGSVVHLDDLLLRRTRVGLLLPYGAQALLPEIRRHCQPVLGWSDERWHQESERYLHIWRAAYSVPENSS
ncbi:glycerol-3-phosphate dehydrogenase/oxidase [Marinobacter sp. X15-166B]|uniref:glycerol-3-phosphate dehydrogenase/oxidase n=1 Tax=Marinobacter sp. X15-166B TaxID=1897620 RepID=UPI00085CBEA7|nr:glycerol-3-phosphate dehydrogenase/oxidase [Marinobacter sp. X15-166B]OEY67538.1 FAD-dependent oxidoreductase [Marinobacter sp. X15-166B]